MSAFPRFTASDVLPFPVVCAQPDLRFSDWMAQQWWSRAYQGPSTAHINEHRQLIRQILRFGGTEVCMAYPEPDLHALQQLGVFLYGAGAQLQPMRNGECHANSATLWRRSPRTVQIMTGYALTIDGLWRQHSWCLDRATGQPIETTTARLAYYGMVLTDADADLFAQTNVPNKKTTKKLEKQLVV